MQAAVAQGHMQCIGFVGIFQKFAAFDFHGMDVLPRSNPAIQRPACGIQHQSCQWNARIQRCALVIGPLPGQRQQAQANGQRQTGPDQRLAPERPALGIAHKREFFFPGCFCRGCFCRGGFCRGGFCGDASIDRRLGDAIALSFCCTSFRPQERRNQGRSFFFLFGWHVFRR